MSYPTIQFEGCTVAVIAPEDLEAKDAEIELLTKQNAWLVECDTQGQREMDRLILELAEAQREKAAALGLQQGMAVIVQQLRRELSDARELLREARDDVADCANRTHKPHTVTFYRDQLAAIDAFLAATAPTETVEVHHEGRRIARFDGVRDT